MSFATAMAATLSSTVTVEVVVDSFPFLSITVKVTVFSPTSAHVKLFGETFIEAIPQASEEPLSIAEAVIATFPVASN